MSILSISILVALAFTLGVLLTGLIAMAKGGEFNQKHANTLMRMRVISQFVAVMLIVLFAFTNG